MNVTIGLEEINLNKLVRSQNKIFWSRSCSSKTSALSLAVNSQWRTTVLCLYQCLKQQSSCLNFRSIKNIKCIELMHQLTEGDPSTGMAFENSWYGVHGCILGLMNSTVQRIGGTSSPLRIRRNIPKDANVYVTISQIFEWGAVVRLCFCNVDFYLTFD